MILLSIFLFLSGLILTAVAWSASDKCHKPKNGVIREPLRLVLTLGILYLSAGIGLWACIKSSRTECSAFQNALIDKELYLFILLGLLVLIPSLILISALKAETSPCFCDGGTGTCILPQSGIMIGVSGLMILLGLVPLVIKLYKKIL